MNDESQPSGAPAPGAPDPSDTPIRSDPAPDGDEETRPLAMPDAPGDLARWALPDAPRGPAPAVPPVSPSVRTQNRIALAGTVALVVALVAGGAFLLGRGTRPADPPIAIVGATPTGGQSAGPTAASSAGPSGDPAPSLPTPLAGEPIATLPSEGNRLGRADARLVVEYWADYQCPFCALFAEERIPDLVPLIADGTIALVHRDFAFIGPESVDAAVAVRCAGREGRYWAMHDAVYAAQAGENKGAFSRDRLATIGESVGLDEATLSACFDDHSLLVAVLDDTAAATRTAIRTTPTIDVNGTRFLGVPDPGAIEAAVADALAGASPKPLPSQVPIPDPWAEIGASGRTAGDAAAPVTVDLWMDYQATDAATIARQLGPELRTRVVDGKIRVVLHDLALLGDESVLAAASLRCIDAQGGPTWLMDYILSVSAQGAGAGIYTADNLLRVSAQLGLDIIALDACLQDEAVAQAVRDETAAGRALGLDTGPAIVVSVGGREVARFSGAIAAPKVLAAIDKAG